MWMEVLNVMVIVVVSIEDMSIDEEEEDVEV